MDAKDLGQLISSAKALYEKKLRATLEASHLHDFVAIEPVSGDYFLGKTISQAMSAARHAHPDRPSHAIRVGHEAALHFGANFR
jgi:hypothetical protein